MGFFSFLEPQQQEGRPNPEGWKVRRKGKDYWENDPDTPAGPDDELSPQDQTPVATADEMKPYSQRRGETSSKVFQTADKIIDKYGGMNGDLAEKAKREVRAKPDDAAKIVEKYITDVVGRQNDAAGVPMGKPDPSNLYDQDFSSLEGHVRGLRTMKRGAEEQGLRGQLAQTDQQKNLATLNSLRSQLDTVTREIDGQNLPEAVSKRGEQENKKILAGKQETAAALAEHIKQLETATGQAKAQPAAGPEELPPPGTREPVTKYMNDLGIDREALVAKLHAAQNVVGIPQDQWNDQNVDTSAGILRVMSSLDKGGTLAQMISQQLAMAKQDDLAAKGQKGAAGQDGRDPQIALTQNAIESKEAKMRELYASLRETPFMKTWPGIILYVLVGMITKNPAFAAQLLGGVGDRAAVKDEIRGIQWDIHRLDQQLSEKEKEEAYSKREAARRMTKQSDEVDQRKWELSKMMIQHQLIIKRNAARGNPETFLMKKLSGDFQRSLGMAGKFSGEMQNEFADPKDRAKARENFEYYTKQAAALDQQIRQMGGNVTAATAGEQEE